MRKNRILFTLALATLLGLVLVQNVAAQGFFDSPFMKSIGDGLSKDIDWPPWGPQQGDTTATVGQLLLVYIALFAILYAAAKLIPIFKSMPNSGAVMWFAFAIAGIAVTSTTFVADVIDVLGFGTDVLSLGGFLVVILLIIVFARWFGGQAGGPLGSVAGAVGRVPGVRQVGEAARNRMEQAGDWAANKVDSRAAKTAATDMSMATADAENLEKVEQLENQEIKELESLKTFLTQLGNVQLTPEQAKAVAKKNSENLKRVVRDALKKHEEAMANVEKANKDTYAIVKNLRRLLNQEFKIDKKVSENDPTRKAIEAYIQDIINKSIVLAKETAQIESKLAAIKTAEEEAATQVGQLVNALNSGNLTAAARAIQLALRSIQIAEDGLRETEDFDKVVSRQLNADIKELQIVVEGAKKEKNQDVINVHADQVRKLL